MQSITNHNANKDIHDKVVRVTFKNGDEESVTFLEFRKEFAAGHNQTAFRQALDSGEQVRLDWNSGAEKAEWAK